MATHEDPSRRRERYARLTHGWLFYLQQGEGPPLIILPAAGSSSWAWRRVMDPLAEHFAVRAVDLPGFDRSETPPGDYTIEDFTDAVCDFMDHAAVGRTSLIGNQTGGMIALDMATRYPERVESLVLVSCPGWTPEEGRIVYERFFLPSYDERGLPRQRSYEEFTKSLANPDEDLANFSNSIAARNGPWFVRVHEVNTSFDIPARLGTVGCPTLLVYGEVDPQLRREQRMREGIQGSRSVTIPNAASLSFYEQPDRFVEEVLPFLRGG